MAGDKAASTAKAEEMFEQILDLARKLAKAIVDYMVEVKSTGHAPSTPPRPKSEVLMRATEGLQLLQLFFKVKDEPYKK
jgi:hypothetical protein